MQLWKKTDETEQFDENFHKAAWIIVKTFRTEQNHEEDSIQMEVRALQRELHQELGAAGVLYTCGFGRDNLLYMKK